MYNVKAREGYRIFASHFPVKKKKCQRREMGAGRRKNYSVLRKVDNRRGQHLSTY